MTASINKSITPFTGKKALMWIVGFFIVIFIVNGLMVFFALSTFGGLETRNPYFKGLYYNRQLAAAAAQKKSGWEISLNHIPATLKGDRLTVRINRPAGDQPPKRVTAVIARAATNVYDQKITLSPSGENQYSVPLTLPLAGQWKVNILVYRTNGALYQLRRDIFIPAEK